VPDPALINRGLDVSWIQFEVPGGYPATEAPATRRASVLRDSRKTTVAAVTRTTYVPKRRDTRQGE